MLGVSKRTIVRRQQEFELKISNTYSNISDRKLDQQVLSIPQDLPKTGYRRMVGSRKARGITVQEKRVRRSMLRVDMEGVLSRSVELTTILRRKYQVKGTKSLWHFDGNHKLSTSKILKVSTSKILFLPSLVLKYLTHFRSMFLFYIPRNVRMSGFLLKVDF